MISNPTAVPPGHYTGYYWLSNSERPVLVSGPFSELLLSQPLPFIVEANLYDAAQQLSISIRHDGRQHIVTAIKLSDKEGYEVCPVSFITHRLEGAPKAKFIEIWRPEPDPLCEGAPVLRPYARAFAGFESE